MHLCTSGYERSTKGLSIEGWGSAESQVTKAPSIGQ